MNRARGENGPDVRSPRTGVVGIALRNWHGRGDS